MPPYLIPLIVGGTSVGGFFWAVINFRRDDTGKVIAQTAEIVTMLRALIDELEDALTRKDAIIALTVVERDDARAECRRLRLRLDDAERRLIALGAPMPDDDG